MSRPEFSRITEDVRLGENVTIHAFVNLYGCTIGDGTRIGTFVEVTRGAIIGARCKISSHTFICGGVTIEDEVFIGHGVMFTNDLYPRATNEDGSPQTEADWTMLETRVCRRASIGSSAVILPGLTIGEGAIVGAGSVVTRDVPAFATVRGNPARVVLTPSSNPHRPSVEREPIQHLAAASVSDHSGSVGVARERSG